MSEQILHIWQPDAAEVNIPLRLQQEHYRLRCLRSLVDSVADSLVFVRRGDSITYKHISIDDTPWLDDVGRLIQRHFKYELGIYIPQGEWHLGMKAVSP